MKVKELKLALSGVPDEVEVMIGFYDSHQGPIDTDVESTLYDAEDGTFTIHESEPE